MHQSLFATCAAVAWLVHNHKHVPTSPGVCWKCSSPQDDQLPTGVRSKEGCSGRLQGQSASPLISFWVWGQECLCVDWSNKQRLIAPTNSPCGDRQHRVLADASKTQLSNTCNGKKWNCLCPASHMGSTLAAQWDQSIATAQCAHWEVKMLEESGLWATKV